MALTRGTGTYIAMAFMPMLSPLSLTDFGGIGVLTPTVVAGASALVHLTMAGADIPVIGVVATAAGMAAAGVAAGAATGDIIITADTIPVGVAVVPIVDIGLVTAIIMIDVQWVALPAVEIITIQPHVVRYITVEQEREEAVGVIPITSLLVEVAPTVVPVLRAE